MNQIPVGGEASPTKEKWLFPLGGGSGSKTPIIRILKGGSRGGGNLTSAVQAKEPIGKGQREAEV